APSMKMMSKLHFRTNYVTTWVSHLRHTHSTTPSLEGLSLRCECGHESFSDKHIYKCDIANFTVIHTSGAKERKAFTTTPQRCILCNMHPTTPSGYIKYLEAYHKTTLK
ncbi:hypothetical protein PMAYCL1PPCAC_08374, partial [Pristionchus mayeri]